MIHSSTLLRFNPNVSYKRNVLVTRTISSDLGYQAFRSHIKPLHRSENYCLIFNEVKRRGSTKECVLILGHFKKIFGVVKLKDEKCLMFSRGKSLIYLIILSQRSICDCYEPGSSPGQVRPLDANVSAILDEPPIAADQTKVHNNYSWLDHNKVTRIEYTSLFVRLDNCSPPPSHCIFFHFSLRQLFLTISCRGDSLSINWFTPAVPPLSSLSHWMRKHTEKQTEWKETERTGKL